MPSFAARLLALMQLCGLHLADHIKYDLFDAGLWTIDDALRIRVAQSDISESILPGGSHFKLADLHGRRLSFAPQATLRPDPSHLAWHRREIFAH